MRSISVLVLVLAALGGLGYLLFMDNDSEGTEVSSTTTVDEAEEAPRVTTPLSEPSLRTDIEAATPRGRTEIEAPAIINPDTHDSGVTGRVVNQEGKPVEGVLMTLAYADELFGDIAGPGGPDKPDRVTNTDEEGKYLFDNLEPADYYTILAKHEEFGSGKLTEVRVPYRTYEQQSDIVLAMGSGLTGSVRDAAGNPILGARVTIGSNLFARGASQRDRRTALTDDIGEYIIPDISGGTYTFMVEKDGFGTHVLNGLPFDGTKGRSRDVTLNFAEGIAGIIIDQRGSPIKGAHVTAVRNRNSKLSCRDSWVTKSDGEFELAHLDAGDYTVLVAAEGYSTGRENVVPTGTNAVTIELNKHAVVRGDVVSASDGSPLSSGVVMLREVISGTDITNQTKIKSKIKGGKFELEGVAPGDYVVEASAIQKGFAPTFSAPFKISQGVDNDSVVITAELGTKVIGRVVDLEGNPVGNAEVSTEDRAGYLPGWPTNIIPQRVRTSSSGHFTLHALKAETYRINVVAAGFVKWTKQDVRVAGGGEMDLGLVNLSRGGTVTGKLIDNYSNPVVGGQVFMRLTDVGTNPRRYSAKSKDGGVYVINNVQPGNYTMWSMPMGIDGPAPGGKRSENKVYVTDNQVATANFKLDYSTVLTRDGRRARDPNQKIRQKELDPQAQKARAAAGRAARTNGGKGGSGQKAKGGDGNKNPR